jgi:hypothetical protein
MSVTNITKFEYEGKPIRAYDDETLSLTDMWRAAGSQEFRKPSEWVRFDDSKKFVAALSELLKVDADHLFTVTNGRNGNTRAHWQIGLAYAKYLSPEFHMWCNTVIRDRMEGRLATRAEFEAVEARIHARTQAIMIEFEQKMTAIATAYDPTRTITHDYRLALHYLEEAGVPPKGRRGLTLKCIRRLLKFAGEEIPGQQGQTRMNQARISNESGKWIFHIDLWREWFAAEGSQVIRAHRDAQAGQTVLPFIVPKKNSKDTEAS